MNEITTRLTDTINEFIEKKSQQVNWTAPSLKGKWSTKEVLGHLIDSAHVNLQRFVRCTYESGFALNYAQDEWVAAQHYRDADIHDLLSLWQLVNKQIVSVLNNYPPERWQAMCNSYTVEFLVADYIDHMHHHLNQIIVFSDTD
jgi:hypothetical protein